jgi:hypothetical protein
VSTLGNTNIPDVDREAMSMILHEYWQNGYAVMLSPMLQHEADWTGKVAIYIYGPDPMVKEVLVIRHFVAPERVCTVLKEVLEALAAPEVSRGHDDHA